MMPSRVCARAQTSGLGPMFVASLVMIEGTVFDLLLVRWRSGALALSQFVLGWDRRTDGPARVPSVECVRATGDTFVA